MSKAKEILNLVEAKEFLVTFQLKKGGSKKEVVRAKDVTAVQAYVRKKYGKRLLEIVATSPKPGYMDYVPHKIYSAETGKEIKEHADESNREK